MTPGALGSEHQPAWQAIIALQSLTLQAAGSLPDTESVPQNEWDMDLE